MDRDALCHLGHSQVVRSGYVRYFPASGLDGHALGFSWSKVKLLPKSSFGQIQNSTFDVNLLLPDRLRLKLLRGISTVINGFPNDDFFKPRKRKLSTLDVIVEIVGQHRSGHVETLLGKAVHSEGLKV